MELKEEPLEAQAAEESSEEFAQLTRGTVGRSETRALTPVAGAVVARLDGFDVGEHPLVSGLPQLPGEVVPARTTLPLLRRMIGEQVVVLCEQGDPRRPIVIGVLQGRGGVAMDETEPPQLVSIQADGDRFVVSAEREIVLRCGDASLTLTRAGKVLIKGNYVLTRSTGPNRIKGAVVDIN